MRPPKLRKPRQIWHSAQNWKQLIFLKFSKNQLLKKTILKLIMIEMISHSRRKVRWPRFHRVWSRFKLSTHLRRLFSWAGRSLLRARLSSDQTRARSSSSSERISLKVASGRSWSTGSCRKRGCSTTTPRMLAAGSAHPARRTSYRNWIQQTCREWATPSDPTRPSSHTIWAPLNPCAIITMNPRTLANMALTQNPKLALA
jgi:hypothetical protein